MKMLITNSSVNANGSTTDAAMAASETVEPLTVTVVTVVGCHDPRDDVRADAAARQQAGTQRRVEQLVLDLVALGRVQAEATGRCLDALDLGRAGPGRRHHVELLHLAVGERLARPPCGVSKVTAGAVATRRRSTPESLTMTMCVSPPGVEPGLRRR